MWGGRADAIMRRVYETLAPHRTATAIPRDGRGDAHGAAGELNEALARAVVGIHRDLVGRGPTRAHAFFRGNVVVVVLNEVMTAGERSLVAEGQREAASRIRRELHDTMRGELGVAVEHLTGAAVDALIIDSDVEADASVALFVLDRPVTGRLRGGARAATPLLRRARRAASDGAS